MKALLCKTYGPLDRLAVEELPPPKPGPRQVRIDVKAAALNFPDALMVQGLYQVKPPLPFTPGSEFSGLVSELGSEVKNFKLGDRVIGFGLGGFAEEAVADAGRVMPLPDGMDFETGAALVLTYCTSLHGLKDCGRLQPGETLLVLGAAGGVGLAAVEIAKAAGARVIACASSDEKLAICRAHGADETINYSTEELRAGIARTAGKRGPDVIYDPVGGKYAEPAFRSIAWRGRYLVIGFADGTIPALPLNLPLLKGASVVGVFWGNFARFEPERHAEGMRQLFGWLQAGKLKPLVSGHYPLAETPQALRDIAARKVTGKIVIEP